MQVHLGLAVGERAEASLEVFKVGYKYGVKRLDVDECGFDELAYTATILSSKQDFCVPR